MEAHCQRLNQCALHCAYIIRQLKAKVCFVGRIFLKYPVHRGYREKDHMRISCFAELTMTTGLTQFQCNPVADFQVSHIHSPLPQLFRPAHNQAQKAVLPYSHRLPLSRNNVSLPLILAHIFRAFFRLYSLQQILYNRFPHSIVIIIGNYRVTYGLNLFCRISHCNRKACCLQRFKIIRGIPDNDSLRYINM